jgi:hypothetical protein
VVPRKFYVHFYATVYLQPISTETKTRVSWQNDLWARMVVPLPQALFFGRKKLQNSRGHADCARAGR